MPEMTENAKRLKELKFAESELDFALEMQERARKVIGGIQSNLQGSAHDAFGQWKVELCDRADLLLSQRIPKWQNLRGRIHKVAALNVLCEKTERERCLKALAKLCTSLSESIYQCGIKMPDSLPITPVNITAASLEETEGKFVDDLRLLETELSATILLMEAASINELTKSKKTDTKKKSRQNWKLLAQAMKLGGARTYLTFSWHHMREVFAKHRQACLTVYSCESSFYPLCEEVFTRTFMSAIHAAQLKTLRVWKYRIADLENIDEWIMLLLFFVLRKDVPEQSFGVRLADAMNDCSALMLRYMDMRVPEHGSFGIYTTLLGSDDPEELDFAKGIKALTESLDSLEKDLCSAYAAQLTESFDLALQLGGPGILRLYAKMAFWGDIFKLPSTNISEGWEAARYDIRTAIESGEQELAEKLIAISSRRLKSAERFNIVYATARGSLHVLREALECFKEEESAAAAESTLSECSGESAGNINPEPEVQKPPGAQTDL